MTTFSRPTLTVSRVLDHTPSVYLPTGGGPTPVGDYRDGRVGEFGFFPSLADFQPPCPLPRSPLEPVGFLLRLCSLSTRSGRSEGPSSYTGFYPRLQLTRPLNLFTYVYLHTLK